MEPTEGMGGSRFVMASRASSDQLMRMRELASQAFKRWQEAGHPGWDVAEADSNLLLDELEQCQVLCCAVLCCAVLCLAFVQLGLQHINNHCTAVLHSNLQTHQMSASGNRSDIKPGYSR